MRGLATESDYFKLLVEIFHRDRSKNFDLSSDVDLSVTLITELAICLNRMLAKDPHYLFTGHVEYQPNFHCDWDRGVLAFECLAGKLDVLKTTSVNDYPYTSRSSADLAYNNNRYRIMFKRIQVSINIQSFIIGEKVKTCTP